MESKPDAKIAVIIPTRSRTRLLSTRALPSVAGQRRRPDWVIVVDDSPERERRRNRNIVNDLRIRGARVVYLKNTRTPGLSGGLNTGLSYLERHETDPSDVFVAFLDDDDAWEPEHLEQCEARALASDLHMVGSGLLRVATSTGGDTHGDEGRRQPAPDRLEVSALLVSNPHIQGSNLFVRLDALLEAGLFDEALRSCTDRDLAIRLADSGVRYGRLDAFTVRHYADDSRERLSTPGSEAKRQGLSAFWAKYRLRMSTAERDAFVERAERLFGWRPDDTVGQDVEVTTASVAPAAEPTGPVVAAIISDDDNATRCAGLLDDLLALSRQPAMGALDVVVLENGRRDGGLDAAVERRRALGLSTFFVSTEQQRCDVEAGRFHDAVVERPNQRLPIAQARTLVQRYAACVARRHGEGAAVWLLDDDSRLDNELDGPLPRRGTISLLAEQLRSTLGLRSEGVAAVLGTVSSAPPVPFSSTVRVQLVDVVHFLRWVAPMDPHDTAPPAHAHNRPLMARADYYYDLSRARTDQLEMPMIIRPAHDSEAAGAMLRRLAVRVMRMFAGEQITRPLLASPTPDLGFCEPSVQRGSNTIVFDLDALDTFPNPALAFDGVTLRRSDMVWALLNRFAGGRRIVRSAMAVRQDRSHDVVNGLDLGRLVPDIQGYALYSSLQDVLERRRKARLRDGRGAETGDDLALTEADLDYGERQFRKYLEERRSAFALSYWRCRGLARELHDLTDPTRNPEAFYHRDPDYADAVAALRSFTDHVRDEYGLDQLRAIGERLERVEMGKVREFLGALRGARGGASTRLPLRSEWLDDQRERNARALCITTMDGRPLRRLGTGDEGVVLTDDREVFKVIDTGAATRDGPSLRALERLSVPDDERLALHTLSATRRFQGRALVRYPFEPSQPYRGEHGAGLVRLLRECRRAGIVTTNLHPKNVIVAGDGVRLVDYGRDVQPYREDLFRSMVQRAYLMWRFPLREDLGQLMSRALRDPALPELAGWERMMQAVTPPPKSSLVDEPVVRRIRGLIDGPRRRSVLDYGCGRGEVACALSSIATVSAWDPDPEARARWPSGRVRWCAERGDIGDDRFDVVTCNLVLCVIDNDAVCREVLADLRRYAADDGHLVLSVCHPDATFAGDSAFQSRCLPDGVCVHDTFTWEKVLASGARRPDVHRPREALEGMLRAAGFEIVDSEETGTVDLETFEAGPEFLILEARPTRPRVRRTRPTSVPVVCYHRVLPRELRGGVTDFHRARGMVVDVDVFEAQLRDLKRSFTPIDLEQYLRGLRGEALPEDAILVTFDDAYRDFREYALPVLDAMEIPSTLFAVERCARTGEPTPVDALYGALGFDQRHGQQLSEAERIDLAFGEAKRAFIGASPELQEAALVALLRRVGADDTALREECSGLYLDVGALSSLGPRVSIGAHGVTHRLLTTLGDTELADELRRSLTWVGELARGAAVLAYPSGRHDARVVVAAARAGFDAAFTVQPWSPTAEVDTMHRLRRSCVPNQADAIERLSRGEEVKL